LATRDFDTVWARIVACEGKPFEQIRGKQFTFSVQVNTLSLSTTNQLISRSQMTSAYELVPFNSTTQLQHLRAPSYLYAILMDPRIRKQDW
jgi:hypothetical protein